MLNQVVIVGRLTSDPEIKEVENERKVSRITLAVPRSWKNAEGRYDTDFISFTLWDSIATNTAEYCKKGDLIGVKGRIQNSVIANDDGETIAKTIEIVAEKISFLSSNKAGDENE